MIVDCLWNLVCNFPSWLPFSCHNFKKIQLRWFGHLGMPPGHLPGELFHWTKALEKTRIHWRDNFPQLAWECLGVPATQTRKSCRIWIDGHSNLILTAFFQPYWPKRLNCTHSNTWVHTKAGFVAWFLMLWQVKPGKYTPQVLQYRTQKRGEVRTLSSIWWENGTEREENTKITPVLPGEVEISQFGPKEVHEMITLGSTVTVPQVLN